MKESIKEIVYKGTLGPSPFNIQAVKYEFDKSNNCLQVHLDKERACMKALTSEHTFKEHCIGVGGSVENIKIAANEYGYKAEVEYCPDKKNRFHLASINFVKSEIKANPLYQYIDKTWSSRFKMSSRTIAYRDLDMITDLVNQYKDYFRIEMVTDKKRCLELAKLSARAETMNWSLQQTQSKHRSFLKFSKREMEKKKDGIGIWEFGMPVSIGKIAKVITNWNIYKFLIPFGIARYVGWSARMKKGKTVKNFSILILKETEDVKRWLTGGELLQKIFLETTKKGIDHQWFSSLYIWDDVNNGLGDVNLLNSKYKKKTLKYSSQLRELVSLKNNEFVLASVALGYSNKTPMPKYRRKVDQVLEVLN